MRARGRGRVGTRKAQTPAAWMAARACEDEGAWTRARGDEEGADADGVDGGAGARGQGHVDEGVQGQGRRGRRRRGWRRSAVENRRDDEVSGGRREVSGAATCARRQRGRGPGRGRVDIELFLSWATV
jgi:hypothetical protein